MRAIPDSSIHRMTGRRGGLSGRRVEVTDPEAEPPAARIQVVGERFEAARGPIGRQHGGGNDVLVQEERVVPLVVVDVQVDVACLGPEDHGARGCRLGGGAEDQDHRDQAGTPPAVAASGDGIRVASTKATSQAVAVRAGTSPNPPRRPRATPASAAGCSGPPGRRRARGPPSRDQRRGEDARQQQRPAPCKIPATSPANASGHEQDVPAADGTARCKERRSARSATTCAGSC